MLTPSAGRPRSAPTTLLSDLCRLSVIATELVAIRQHLDDAYGCGEQLDDDVVVVLDDTITALLHAAPASAETRVPEVGGRPEPRRRRTQGQ